MPKYKLIVYYPSGAQEEGIFDTEEEAEDYGCDCAAAYAEGAETLHMSNPGDYPDDGDEQPDYEVIEIDD
jgi:hypothetical protein